ncbi:tetratricopeptide repeat protein [Hymenobacter convexus]|uniref:tetratricopeptide repeat protein n=1 Tax=Hymenobacter sp. CA1UV-4 TaxID=3063782 RepID=UPI00271308B8|nr:tetratricopeptide repeat protein [Hymenobacter sp. CA1UV-4]MDO7851849.1 tetratricopeptide repeat protein [Hymenobacter sp. CA1UV-4]
MKLFPRLALAATLSAAAPLAAQAQQTQVFASDERHFQEGLELFDRAQYGAAQEAFRQYLTIEPVHSSQAGPAAGDRTADAEYYYAVSGLYLSHPDAEGLILDFAARHPAHPRAASAYFELGKFYFDQKNYESAIRYFAKVAPDNLSNDQRAESDFKLGYSYFEQKDYEKARLLFDRNKQVQSQYKYASSYYAGYLGYRAGDYAAARADLSVAGQNDAYKPVVPAVMTQIYYREGNYDGLITYATKSLQDTPPPQNADEIQLLLGDAYYQKGQYKEAAENFDKYAVLHKGKIEPALEYKIGFANYKMGDFKGAIASLRNVAVRRDSLGQNAAYHLGLSYIQTNQKPQAVTAFDAARQSTFDKGIAENATLKLGQVQYELGNLPEVIAVLRDFRKKFPRSKNQPVVDDLLSKSFLSSTDYNQALTYLESIDDRSAQLDATYQRVAYSQAATLYNNGNYAEALPLLDKSLKFPSDDALRAAAQVLRGEIFSVGQKYPDAITAYVAAARSARQGGVSPEEKDFEQKARYGLGYAYYNTKQYDKARPQFNAFLNDDAAKSDDPNYYDATLRLADTYYVSKSYAQALTLYDKVITANAADKDYAYYQKGRTLGLMGRRDEANSTLAALLKSSPNSRYAEDAVFQQAQLSFEAGEYQPAVDGFSKLIANRPNSPLLPQALQKRGVSYANLQQQDKAVLDFQKVLADYPRSEAAAQAIYSLQESLTALGRTEEFDAALASFKIQNPDSKATESVEFEAAKSLYLAEKYKPAILRLESYLKQYPQSALGPDARFFLADSYVKTGDKQQGLTRLRDVVTEGKSEFVNRAVGRLADLEYENKNYAEAAKYYERLRGASTNRREVANATLGQMRSLYEAGDYPGTRRVAEELRAQAGATANATNSALLYLGKASYRAESYDQAATELAAAVAAAPNDVNGAEAQYFLAQTLFKQKKNEEAIAAALKVNSNFSSYPLWQGRAFLLVADVYAAEGDNFQARGTLNSLVDNNFPVAEVLEAAKQRLKTLGADQPEETEPVKPTPKAPAKTPAKAPAPTKAATPATKPATPPAPAKGKTTVPRSNLRGTTTAPADTATQR